VRQAKLLRFWLLFVFFRRPVVLCVCGAPVFSFCYGGEGLRMWDLLIFENKKRQVAMCVCVWKRNSVKPFSLCSRWSSREGRKWRRGRRSRKQSRGIRPRRYVVRTLSLCVHTRPVGTVGKGGKQEIWMSFGYILFLFFGRVGGLCYRWQPEFLYFRHFVCVTGTSFFLSFPFTIIIFE
jgi:hypothetical protein